MRRESIELGSGRFLRAPPGRPVNRRRAVGGAGAFAAAAEGGRVRGL